MTINYEKIPKYILEGLYGYQEFGWELGGFLTAVLENDLYHAIARADQESLSVLKDIVSYIHWEMPANCNGSPELVAAWKIARRASQSELAESEFSTSPADTQT